MKLKYYLVLLICPIISCNNGEQEKHLEAEKIANISFSKKEVSATTAPEYTNSFTLNRDEFLNIHFTLKTPLIKSIRSLAPQLTESELLEKGNFHFSFLVDGKIIYTENLHKGAGLKTSKTEQLKHTIRLAAPNQLDYWGWFMWLKFMKLGGGQDALAEGKHDLTIEVRSYLLDDTLKISNLLAKGNIEIEVANIVIDESIVPVQKIQPNSGWILSEDSFDHERIEALNRKIAEGRFENINGIVVLKNEKLLLEEYFNGSHRDSLHDPKSVGKSIASSMLGIAISDGFITDEGRMLKDFYNLRSFENYSEKKTQ